MEMNGEKEEKLDTIEENMTDTNLDLAMVIITIMEVTGKAVEGAEVKNTVVVVEAEKLVMIAEENIEKGAEMLNILLRI